MTMAENYTPRFPISSGLPYALASLFTSVQSAKWIAGKRKQPRSGHLLVLCLCGRVIEGMREVTNR